MRGRAFFLVTLMVLMVQTAYVLGVPSAESTINSESENAFSGNSTAPLHVLVNNTEMDPISFTAPWTSNNSNNSGSGGGSGMTSGVPVGILQGREYQNMEHVIDSNDKHHLIHYRYYDGLFYSTNSGGSWVTTMLDNGSNYLGSESDIVVDSNNDPHVVYKASGALNYTYLSNGVWSAPTTLDTLVYTEPKMVIDSNDTIHIVSIFRSNNGLANYTTNAGGSWTTETINQYPVYPLIADIALDSTGKVYIALITGTGTSQAQKQLNVYEKTGSTWSKDPVDSGQFGSTYKVELAIDANDVKHIYYQGSSGVFIKNDANGTWSSGNEYIAPTSGDGSVVLGDMKIEPNGTVHVVYRGSQCAVSWTSHCTFWYSTNSSGTWATRNIANITGLVLPTYNALELDSYGNLHYFFRNGTWAVNGTLFHLVENGVSTVGGSSGGGGSGGSGTGSAPVIYNGNGTSWLVADINPNGWDYIQYLTTVGTRLFFGADDGTHGEELWTHETTNGSTWMVADIRTNGSGTPEHFLAIGTRIFFEAVDDNNNHELYAHEMSNDSTWRVTNFSIFNSAPTPFGSVGSRLFFYANDGTHGREVWVHEMTNDSTWMVGDINNGSSGSGPGDGIAVGTRFYFRAQDWGNGNNGGDIWVYETTNESFWKFTDHHLGGPSLPRNFVSIGTKIFFGGANNSSGDHELWVIETTNESTWQATDVLPTPFWSWNRVEKVTAIGSKVVFSSRSPNVTTTDLWIHETTNESTWKADDLALGWADWSIPFAHVGTRLFFQIDDASNGSELGAFEITNESSWMVDDLPGHPSAGSGPNHIVAAGTQLFFQATSGLWAHDPANIGSSGSGSSGSGFTIYNGNGSTWTVADILPNSIATTYLNNRMITHGNRLYFDGSNGVNGTEIFVYDGTNQSTWMLTDLTTSNGGNSAPNDFVMWGDNLIFTYTYSGMGSSNSGRVFGMYNATSGIVTKDIASSTNTSISSHYPVPYQYSKGEEIAVIGDSLFFEGKSKTQSPTYTTWDMWEHNLSNGSTWKVTNICPVEVNTNCRHSSPSLDYGGSGAKDFAVVGDQIFFSAQYGSYIHNSNNAIRTLWVYDTSNRSYWQADMQFANLNINDDAGLVSVNGILYFSTRTPLSNAYELFAYNPLNHTLWQVADIATGTNNANIYYLTVVGSQVLFSAHSGSNTPYELWVHETKNGSTWEASNFGNSNSVHFVGNRGTFSERGVAGTRLYFQGLTPSVGYELFAYESTNGSVWLVVDLASSASSNPSTITTMNNRVYFHADAGDGQGRVLWGHDPANLTYYSSGSGGGSGSSGSGLTTYNGNGTTWQAFDLFGQSSSSPTDITPIGDVLYFSIARNSLWAYNTSNQTEWEVHDFNPNGSDDIREIFALGTRLYFEAKDDNNPLGQPLNTHLNKQLWTYETTNDTAWKLTNHTFVSQVLTHNNVAKYLFYGGFSLMGTRLYFTAQDSNGVQIWAHETTNESTWAVTNIGMYGVQEGQDPIIVMGSQLYFGANNGDTEGGWGSPLVYNELWAYDTTNETAWMTSNLCTPGCSGFSSSNSMTSIGTRIFFTGVIEINQTRVSNELFAHETTNGSTWLVEDISPSNNNPTGSPLYYVSMGSTIYFEAEDNQSGREPWAYDVTNDTAWQVCDVNPNSSVNGGDGGFFQPFAMGDRIFFQGDDGIHGSELWALDTINGACWMVADINTYSAGISSTPSGFAAVGNQLYFSASKKVSQNKWDGELWVHDPANLTFTGSGGSSGTSGGGGGISNASVIWSISPSLPTNVTINQVDGTISGTPTQVMVETIYTILATHSSGNFTTFEVSLMVLEDTDGDGDPDSLPVDYDTTGPTPGLVEDLDDDNDGYADVVETNTGTYSGTNDTGTDPLNPDTDGDGICDGPNDVLPVCTAGPDRDPPTNVVGVIDIAIETVEPYLTFPNMTYTISPELPAGLVFDSSTGELSGTATSPLANTTFTVYGNLSNGAPNYSWQFTIEILDDSDGDGLPNELPIDYPLDGELIEDTDDDNDGLNDTTESGLNTSTTNPDTDGDGFCDGPIAIINGTNGVTCYAGPDPYPLDSNAPLDTDGDGLPDENDGWTGPPMEDEDDDNDGYPDVSELACGSDPLNASSHPNDMDGDAICDGDDDDMDGDGIDNANETGNATTEGTLPDNPDTDGDGVCDGPISPITSNCIAGPDDFPLDPSAWLDTDDDGYPDEVAGNSTSVPPLVEDDDDDNDGWNDTLESDCLTDSKDELDVPADLNDDGLCDVNDDDWDDDGVTNDDETNTSLMGTDPWDPDTDDDGFCDGPIAFEGLCYAGPDPYPLDPNAPIDTDGDGLPDENDGWTGPPQADDDDDNDGTLDVDDAFPLDDGADTDTDGDGDPDTILYSNYDGPLIADEDDDDDGWNDTSEIECSTDPLDSEDVPVDDDDNGVCDILDPKAEISGDGENEEDIIENSENLNIFSIWSCCILLLMLLLIFALLYRRSDDERDEQFVVFEIDDAFDDEDDELKKQSVKNKEEEYNEIYGSDEDATISEKKAKLAELDAQLAAKEAEINALNAAAANKVDFDTIGTATASEKDDLTKIKGIGPVLQGKLNDAGIFTLKQLSKVTPEIENQIDEAIGYFPGRLSREKVFDQARELLKN